MKKKRITTVEEFKKQTKQPHLTDYEAQEMIASLEKLAEITYKHCTMKKWTT